MGDIGIWLKLKYRLRILDNQMQINVERASRFLFVPERTVKVNS